MGNYRSGRKPRNRDTSTNWFRTACHAAVIDAKLPEFWASVVKGELTECRLTHAGKIRTIPVGMEHRLKASELLAAYDVGKPIQQTEVSGADGERLVITLAPGVK